MKPLVVLFVLLLLSIVAVAGDGSSAPATTANTNNLITKPYLDVTRQPRPMKSFWTMVAVSSVLTAMDVELTNSCVRSGQCREANPLYGSNPTRARMYGISVPITAGANLMSYMLHRRNRGTLGFMPQLGLSLSHVAGIGTNVAVRR